MNSLLILKKAALTEALSNAMGKEAFADFVANAGVPAEVLQEIKEAAGPFKFIQDRGATLGAASIEHEPQIQKAVATIKGMLPGTPASVRDATTIATSPVANIPGVAEAAGAISEKAPGVIAAVGDTVDKAKGLGGSALDALRNFSTTIDSNDLGVGALGGLFGQMAHGAVVPGAVGAMAGNKLGPKAMEMLLSNASVSGLLSEPMKQTLQSLSGPIGATTLGFLGSKATHSLFGDDDEEEDKKKRRGRDVFASATKKTASAPIAIDVQRFVLKLASLHPALAQEATELFVTLADTVHESSTTQTEKTASKEPTEEPPKEEQKEEITA